MISRQVASPPGAFTSRGGTWTIAPPPGGKALTASPPVVAGGGNAVYTPAGASTGRACPRCGSMIQSRI